MTDRKWSNMRILHGRIQSHFVSLSASWQFTVAWHVEDVARSIVYFRKLDSNAMR